MRRFFALLVRLFPPAFRHHFGPEIVRQATDDVRRAREGGRLSGAAGFVATSADLIRTALAEHVRPTWVTSPDTELEEGGIGMWMSGWIRDLQVAGRTLVRAPGFVVAAVGTLALAIGANAGIFSVVDTVLIEPLPFPEPDRLVYIASSAPGSDFPDEFGVSAEFLVQYEEEADLLEGVAAYNSFTATLRVGDRTERVPMSFPTRSLFEVLGVPPALGRLPTAEDGDDVVVLSHRAWVEWFGADPEVIGRTPFVTGRLRTVIGVMPPEFRFPNDGTLLWIGRPDLDAASLEPGRFGIPLVARMKAGVDHASLTRQLTELARRLPERFGGSPRYARLIEQHVPVVRSLEEQLLGPVSGALWLLMAALLVVLLIACANVANLFAVRAEARGRDLAVRRALGAGRAQLVRFLMADAALVAVLAGAGALGLAAVALPAFLRVAPQTIPRIGDTSLSMSTVAFTVGVTAFSALACGLIPAVRSSRARFSRLRDEAWGSTSRRSWGRDGLVVAQTALALVLLIGSTLLFKSFSELSAVDPGYETRDIFTFQFAPEQAHLVDGPSWAQFHLDFMDRLRALPGVESVGIVENVPLDEGLRGARYQTEETAADPDAARLLRATFAGGDYFETMGIEVLMGRPLEERDLAEHGNVVIGKSTAELLWPGQNPIGRRIMSTDSEEWHTVVGVVEDVLQYDFRTEPEPMVYFPLVGPTPDSWALSSPGYVVKTTRAATIAPEVRALVREVAPEAPMYRTYTMEGLADRSMARLSFTMLTLAAAAGLALVLGAVGLYGVLSYVVSQRTREIGVRMALGAEPAGVRRMVVRQGTTVVAVGVVLGLLVALLATRALGSLLFGVEALDVGTFASMATVMLLVGAFASYVPALRASSVDPIESIRVG